MFMKAMVYTRYGGPDVFELKDVVITLGHK
jgi:hypothetical protein